LGWVGYGLLSIAWAGLHGVTLSFVATVLCDHLLKPISYDGYSAYIALMGYLLIMPAALVGSLVVLGATKRWWVFLGLAPVTAAATALAPALIP
jgi:hypothetical protein